MPRQSRETSATCVYHVILRGVNKQQIFEDDDDYMRFLSVLRRQTQPFDDDKGQFIPPRCYVYAYCLMGNHVHLLIKEGSEAIGDTMKRIASSYVYYYNHKYDRVGHLFQERFKSQPVNDFTYFITLLRYIHQNPLKASLVKNIQNYAWSSWMEYTGAVQHGFCSTGVVLDRMSLEGHGDRYTDPQRSNEDKYIKYNEQNNIFSNISAIINDGFCAEIVGGIV